VLVTFETHGKDLEIINGENGFDLHLKWHSPIFSIGCKLKELGKKWNKCGEVKWSLYSKFASTRISQSRAMLLQNIVVQSSSFVGLEGADINVVFLDLVPHTPLGEA
jgi:hypothetical protein